MGVDFEDGNGPVDGDDLPGQLERVEAENLASVGGGLVVPELDEREAAIAALVDHVGGQEDALDAGHGVLEVGPELLELDLARNTPEVERAVVDGLVHVQIVPGSHLQPVQTERPFGVLRTEVRRVREPPVFVAELDHEPQLVDETDAAEELEERHFVHVGRHVRNVDLAVLQLGVRFAPARSDYALAVIEDVIERDRVAKAPHNFRVRVDQLFRRRRRPDRLQRRLVRDFHRFYREMNATYTKNRHRSDARTQLGSNRFEFEAIIAGRRNDCIVGKIYRKLDKFFS